MGKRDASPTHGWIIMSHVNVFVVRFCLMLFACLAIAIGTLVLKVHSSCSERVDYDWKLLGYELRVGFNQDYDKCVGKPVVVSP